jgi:hypothetical protein
LRDIDAANTSLSPQSENKATPSTVISDLRLEKSVIGMCYHPSSCGAARTRIRSLRAVTTDIFVGESGDSAARASKVPRTIDRQNVGHIPSALDRPSVRVSSESGITRRLSSTSQYVGARPEEILERCLKVKEYELHRGDFSEMANLGLGIQELIGARYDPTIGIFGIGMDLCAVITALGPG